jgi:hypothetical protein
MNLKVPQNAGKLLSSCATGGFSGRDELHVVSVSIEGCASNSTLYFIATVEAHGDLWRNVFMFSASRLPFILDRLGRHGLGIWDTDPRRIVGHLFDSHKMLFGFHIVPTTHSWRYQIF